jgi:cephalosporin hydroxylase
MMNLRQLYDQLADQYGSKTGEMVFTFSDKGSMHSYIEFYEMYFEKKRDRVTLLEIGMMTGGSLHLWQKYFKQYELVGMDLSKSWNAQRAFQSELESDPDITLLFEINSRDSNIPSAVEGRRFDFVIDDGDHSVEAQMDTFRNYWPLTSDTGTYFIEDVVGPRQIDALKEFLQVYSKKHDITLKMEHYRGFKNNRADDQILAVSRVL